MKPSEILNAAADLITPEGAWGRQGYARTKQGCATEPTSPDAVCFCMMGAIKKFSNRIAGPRHFLKLSVQKLSRNPDAFPEWWNDQPRRTQAQAIRALRKAAKLAEEAGE